MPSSVDVWEGVRSMLEVLKGPLHSNVREGGRPLSEEVPVVWMTVSPSSSESRG